MDELETQSTAHPENWVKDDYGRIKPVYTSSTATDVYKPSNNANTIIPVGPVNPAYKPDNKKPTYSEILLTINRLSTRSLLITKNQLTMKSLLTMKNQFTMKNRFTMRSLLILKNL